MKNSLINITFATANDILKAFVLTKFWAWFVMVLFISAPPLHLLMAICLMLGLEVISGYKPPHSSKDTGEIVVHWFSALSFQAIVLGSGYLLHSLM